MTTSIGLVDSLTAIGIDLLATKKTHSCQCITRSPTDRTEFYLTPKLHDIFSLQTIIKF
ncbi:hypothetical protein [Chamaesiphon sp. OTE_20_metabat_361]|uniref:hypothetical protein n=1 Tax=Chamaesiphon sp. OTE_20_metabat_361 TaxID=2964689 RepID=UPI00286ABE5F|nr:hypothetical protein [Chamaesiphon sp. OTE_20_metabat_361]